MEKSMSLLLGIRDVFDCKPVDIRTYSPLTLAFVGDCVYDLVIRTVVAERGNTAPNTLHQKKSAVVKAQAQAAQAEAIFEELTAEEQPIPILLPKTPPSGITGRRRGWKRCMDFCI